MNKKETYSVISTVIATMDKNKKNKFIIDFIIYLNRGELLKVTNSNSTRDAKIWFSTSGVTAKGFRD